MEEEISIDSENETITVKFPKGTLVSEVEKYKKAGFIEVTGVNTDDR